MKHTLRIPTEMYAFIETEFEGSVEDAVALYNQIKEATAPKPVNEMSRNEFNEIFDLVWAGKPIADDPGILDKMSPAQRYAINEVKKAVKRARNNN